MIIYVKKHQGLFELVVDKNGESIFIPSWRTKEVLAAEEEGAQYREAGAIMARVTYDTYRKLDDQLTTMLNQVNNLKTLMEHQFPEGEPRVLAQFMIDNQDTFQHAGDSYLIKDDNELVIVDKGTAKHLMETYQRELDEF